MAYFFFNENDQGDGDMDNLANYTNSNENRATNGSAATSLPVYGDTVWLEGQILKGTSYADWDDGLLGASQINGGTFYGQVIAPTLSIYDGTFFGPVTDPNTNGVYGGTFNGTVQSYAIYGGTFNEIVNATGGQIFAGTFNDQAVAEFGSIYGGTFNSYVDGYSVYITGGIFNGAVNIADGQVANDFSGSFNGSLSFDGATWLYSPQSPAVAPADKVLSGTSNLGVAGTAAQVATSGRIGLGL